MLDTYLTKKLYMEPTSGCWIWLGWVNPDGYGHIKRNKKMYMTHRYVYEKLNNPIPSNMTVDHICRVRSCCNPDHMDIVTQGENMRRSPRFNLSAIHCKRGHEFTPENSYMYKNGSRRTCRKCVYLSHNKLKSTPPRTDKER